CRRSSPGTRHRPQGGKANLSALARPPVMAPHQSLQGGIGIPPCKLLDLISMIARRAAASGRRVIAAALDVRSTGVSSQSVLAHPGGGEESEAEAGSQSDCCADKGVGLP